MSRRKHSTRRRIKPLALFVGAFFLAGIGLIGYDVYTFLQVTNAGDGNSIVQYTGPTPTATAYFPDVTPKPTPVPTASTSALPASVHLTVPFTVQAPNANWDAAHEEACEEASLLMVKHFKDGTQFGTPDQADAEIKAVLQYETDNGYGTDVTVQQLQTIAKAHFAMSTGRVETGISIDDIKTELAAGRPVIVPAAGQELPNPNFKAPGPVYHMLVVVGYTDSTFITNDPGTKNGKDFIYSYSGLYNAIHNWNSLNIDAGEKAFLVFD